jgi:hypothetical protein
LKVNSIWTIWGQFLHFLFRQTIHVNMRKVWEGWMLKS